MTDEHDKFEAWAIVEGYESLYEISSLGRVRRVGRATRNGDRYGGGARIGRVLAHLSQRGGYIAVQLWKDGRMRRFLLHVLVARAFIGRPPPGTEVNHIDGNKRNPAASNLEYVTRSENIRHAYRTGLRTANVPSGEAHHNAKLSSGKAIEIRRRYVPGVCTLKMLAREYGVDHKTIHRVVSGKGWRTSI